MTDMDLCRCGHPHARHYDEPHPIDACCMDCEPCLGFEMSERDDLIELRRRVALLRQAWLTGDDSVEALDNELWVLEHTKRKLRELAPERLKAVDPTLADGIIQKMAEKLTGQEVTADDFTREVRPDD